MDNFFLNNTTCFKASAYETGLFFGLCLAEKFELKQFVTILLLKKVAEIFIINIKVIFGIFGINKSVPKIPNFISWG